MTDQEAVKPVNPTISLKPKEPVLIQEDSLKKTSGHSIKKARSINQRLPKEDEKEIFTVLNDHFYALKMKDLDRYMATLSKTAQGFDYEAERLNTIAVFEQFPYTLTLKEARVYKTGQDLRKAAVYALIGASRAESNETWTFETVIVFKKDPDGWKASAAIGLPILLKR